jgi:hypothetical protein
MLRYLLLTATLLYPVAIAGSQALKVPAGRHIMVDGNCEAAEWIDAAALKASDNFTLRFKKTADFVFVCVDAGKESNLMIDLYFSPSKEKLYTFHASAKLGERTLKDGKWEPFTADWNWWKIKGWTANTLRVKGIEGPTFESGKAIELQIDRNHFGGRDWLALFDFISEPQPFIFPRNSDKLKSETWLELQL